MSPARLATGAVDVGGTKIALAVVSLEGELLAQRLLVTMDYPQVQEAVKSIGAGLADLARQAGCRLQRVGIGCTGQMDPENGVILHLEYLPGWSGTGLVQGLAARLGVPVHLANDAETAALGEWWAAGGDRLCGPLVMVTFGTGIGVGVVSQGRLWRGVGGAHPEIGHHVLAAPTRAEPDDLAGLEAALPRCYCGQYGCWESLASGTALEMFAAAQIAESHAPAPLSARQVCELARQGDAPAQAAVRRSAHFMGVGVANLATLFAPGVIVLGGGLMDSSDLFLPAIQQALAAGCKLVPTEKVQLRLARLGAQAGLVGAARLGGS